MQELARLPDTIYVQLENHVQSHLLLRGKKRNAGQRPAYDERTAADDGHKHPATMKPCARQPAQLRPASAPPGRPNFQRHMHSYINLAEGSYDEVTAYQHDYPYRKMSARDWTLYCGSANNVARDRTLVHLM